MASSLSVLDGSLPEDLNNYGKQFRQKWKCEVYVVIFPFLFLVSWIYYEECKKYRFYLLIWDCYVQISNVIMLSHREKIITFLSIPAAVGSDGLPIGQYFLYKLIAQQKDVGYKNLLRTDLVTKVRQETINRQSELYKKLHYKYRYNLLSFVTHFPSNVVQAQQTMLDYLQLPEIDQLSGKYNRGTLYIIHLVSSWEI